VNALFVPGGEAMMVFGAGSSIRSYYLSSRILFKIAKEQGQVAGIGFDGDHIYWTNVKKDEEAIMRCDEDGSNTQVIVTAGETPSEILASCLVPKFFYHNLGACNSTQYPLSRDRLPLRHRHDASIGYWTNYYRDSHSKELKNRPRKVKSSP